MAAKEELQDDVPRCEFIHAHPETIKAVQESMPAEEELYDLSELLRSLPTPPGSVFSMFSWNTKCVSAIWPSF